MANPANTNALILKENAPSIPAKNITALTRLDHNRALGQVGSKPAGPIIWGSAERLGGAKWTAQELDLHIDMQRKQLGCMLCHA